MYKELFGEALEKYNAKQTRSDRKISNYYEKIRSGKQEKLFHELILQIGNCNDTNAQSEFGAEAAEMLDEYMRGFQERNPHLRVFAAYLHMDEATPHLHIDFIPFTTGSKRGLETRVSLKSALAQQGIVGGTKLETEWNLFVSREKEQLAQIMQSHGVEWKKLGTHEKHLSVLDYEKKMRSLEVAELTERVDSLKDSKETLEEEISEAERKRRELNEEIEELKTHVNTSFVPDSLDYLHKGGRVSGLIKTVASILKIHPLIQMEDGQLVSGRKYKGKMSFLIKQYVEDLKEKYPNYDKTRCFITHSSADSEVVEAAKAKVLELFDFNEVIETVAGSIVTSHCGQGTLGVLFIYNK